MAKLLFFYLFILSSLLIIGGIYLNDQYKSVLNVNKQNVCPIDQSFISIKTRSLIACAIKCRLHPKCKFFAFNISTSFCQMYASVPVNFVPGNCRAFQENSQKSVKKDKVYNVAMNKMAVGSSYLPALYPSWAFDGNYANSYTGGPWYCFHANGAVESVSWMMVDLVKMYYVMTVAVLSRGECCPERLDNFLIQLGNSGWNATPSAANFRLCGQWQGLAFQNSWMSLACDLSSPPSRYVSVHGGNDLTVCEMEIFGEAELYSNVV